MTLSWIFTCHFWWLWKRNWSHLVFCNLPNLYERWGLLLSAVLHLLAVHPDVVLVVAITEVLWDSVSLPTSWCVSKWRFWERICSYHAMNTLVIWVSLLTWNNMRNWSSASSWWPLQINPCRFESCSPNGSLITGHQRGYMWILNCK